jgi:hypothetical protein
VTAPGAAPLVFQDFLKECATDSAHFVRSYLGTEPLPWQLEVLEQYDRRTRRISIRSGHGVGKTWLLAWIMLHHQLTRFPQKTVVTAPTADQLWDALWAEYRSWVNRLALPLREMIELKSDRCELKAAPSESFVSARTSRPEAPDAMQGVHSGDRDGEGHVLLIGDEAAGIPDAVFEAAGGSMSGHHCTIILTGNPTHVGGYFYDTHTKLQDRWWTRRVPRSECPYADPEYDREIAARYGEFSNVYRVRVLGEFPQTEDDTVIPRELVLESLKREITSAKTTPTIWGLDCARFGDDRSALCKRQGNVVLERIKTWRKKDTMTLAATVWQEYQVTPPHLRPAQINVDVIGIGAGVQDRLRMLGAPARGVNVSESPALLHAETYLNLRAELWFKCREWFERREAKLPESYQHRVEGEDLVTELSTPTYEFQTRSGRLMVEGKEDVKKRLSGSSPDLAEALILTFASDAITLSHGRTGMSSWQKPLTKELGLV